LADSRLNLIHRPNYATRLSNESANERRFAFIPVRATLRQAIAARPVATMMPSLPQLGSFLSCAAPPLSLAGKCLDGKDKAKDKRHQAADVSRQILPASILSHANQERTINLGFVPVAHQRVGLESI
jgi:hypothetical protein